MNFMLNASLQEKFKKYHVEQGTLRKEQDAAEYYGRPSPSRSLSQITKDTYLLMKVGVAKITNNF